ncbi:hypothetical protein MFFC18_18320 [Mariniblastus fucicola]|uniref:Uncharacterized protein n=2 Tax=Pirellulaceae TaxID=2691357 RepID=A0A5B9PGF5_9BACT|nr:hypothetical protein MFFC18_18320 [Mariniblastus fucicola]
MIALRWILGLTCLSLYSVMIISLLMMAVRRIRTGQFASGLSFVPSALATIGILMLPISTVGYRAAFAILPFAFESMYFVFNVAYDLVAELNEDNLPS